MDAEGRGHYANLVFPANTQTIASTNTGMDKMASTQAVAPLPCPGVMVRRGGARGAGSYQGCDSSHTVHRRYTIGLRMASGTMYL